MQKFTLLKFLEQVLKAFCDSEIDLSEHLFIDERPQRKQL